MSGCYQFSDVCVGAVKGRDTGRGKHRIVVLVRHDVQHLARNVRVLTEEPIPISALQHQDHTRMFRLEADHLVLRKIIFHFEFWKPFVHF